ncbi:ComEC/Rec2 family competence protein [Actinomyces trachealis]|uniref:ComEC/Rec2 family competence protein n=1 Tax=Actinomyces trachealis TaxID=2763540 RepID=UPI0018928C1E|nr:ComEC/Rec2 family competence protein [Actinomyces trachealis]
MSATVTGTDVPSALDLRLAPPALAAWGTAWIAVTATGPGAWIKPALACVAASLGAMALLLVVARYRPPRHRRDPRPGTENLPQESIGSAAASLLLVAMAVVAMLLVTSAQTAVRQADPLTQAVAAGQPVTIVATLTQAPRVVNGGHGSVSTELRVESVDGAPSQLTVRVIGRGRWAQLCMGEQVRVRTTPKPTVPGERAGAVITGAQVRPLAPPTGLTGTVQQLRDQMRHALHDLQPPGPEPPDGSRELVLGLALGDDSGLPTSLREDLRTVSLTHLTAVSGQHVAIVLGLVLSGMGVLPRRMRALVGLLVLAGLVVLVRPGGSVLRAATMGTVLLLGVALGRRSVALPALFTGVLVLLLMDPWQARDYGFALSVVATAAILLWARPLESWLSRLLPRWLAVTLALPLVAQLACAPVLVLLRPTWSPWAVPANVLAAPPVAVSTVSGLVASLLAPISPSLAGLVALPALLGCAWIVKVAQWVAVLPGAALPWSPGVPGSLLMAFTEAVGVMAVRRWWTWRCAWRRRRQARMWDG